MHCTELVIHGAQALGASAFLGQLVLLVEPLAATDIVMLPALTTLILIAKQKLEH